MKKQLGKCILLPTLLLLGLLLACSGGDGSETASIPIAVDPGPLSSEALSGAELQAVQDFASQQEALGLEWDKFHKDLDDWRAGLSSCHESAARDALREFAAEFNGITEQTRDLPRAKVTRKFADMLIEAAEAEAASFRQLRDRWQTNNLSLFEAVEQQRSNAARAQNEVADLAAELEGELEEASDPDDTQAREEFSAAFEQVQEDWEGFHKEYDDLLDEAGSLTPTEILGRLDQLIQQFTAVVEAVRELPTAAAVEDMTELLQGPAGDELDLLVEIHDTLAEAVEDAAAAEEDAEEAEGAPAEEQTGHAVEPLLKFLTPTISAAEEVLEEVDEEITAILDRDTLADLMELRTFLGAYKELLGDWDGFHQRYSEWRRTEGGCNRTQVLEVLTGFDTRIGEISLSVRDLPKSGYLLPMYNLLVEAAEREEGAIRTLRNSWQPFTADAFIAVERERGRANGLRREAQLALQELLDRR